MKNTPHFYITTGYSESQVNYLPSYLLEIDDPAFLIYGVWGCGW